jgi:hypothetical protein
MKRQEFFHSQISSSANKHAHLRVLLSHNSRKAQPTLGGAMKLYLSKKMSKESNESQSYNIRGLKAIGE